MKHIVIVGGGFCGTSTAVNLCRLGVGGMKITIVNAGYPLGRGIAYSTRNGSHLLNVAARNMSALADQPSHFVDWLRTRSEFSEEPVARLREMFVPRRLYGDYIHGLLFAHSGLAAQKGITIETIATEAVRIAPSAAGAQVELGNGQSLSADKVILATGNPPPSRLKIKGLDPACPKCFQNPWVGWETKLTDRSENVILVGTGLTAIDVFLSLKDLGWKGKIFAISRNGLLPQSHFKGIDYPDWLDASKKPTLPEALKSFRSHYRKATARGVNPAILVDKLRAVTPELWHNFSRTDKARFNRHFRTRWNVVRHRIAQSLHQQLMEAIASHRLEVVKGRLIEAAEYGDQLVITIKTGETLRRIEGGALINCTGPSESYSRSASALYANLLSAGLAQSDEMDMGIQINSDFAVIGKDGQPSSFLFAIGPVLKGTLWETSAVPELRSQTFRVAEVLVKQLYGKQFAGLEEAKEIVHEYEI